MPNPMHQKQFGKAAYVQPTRYTIQTGNGIAEGKSEGTRNALALVMSATSPQNKTAYDSALVILEALTDERGKVADDKREDIIALYWNSVNAEASLKAGKAVYNPSEWVKVYEASRDAIVTHCNAIKDAFEACNEWNAEGKVWTETRNEESLPRYISFSFGFFPPILDLDLEVGNDEVTAKRGKTSGKTITKE